MDYSKIHIAERVLEVAGIPIPDSEDEIREKAYQYLGTKDFLAAHQIRLGKQYSAFTRDEWKEIIEISGKDAVRDNIAAMVCCLKQNLSVM